MRTLVWYRGKDLRVSDHAPLFEAVKAGEVIPLFVIDPYFFNKSRAKELPHRIEFLLKSLRSLQANLRHLGSDLVIAQGKSVEVVPKLAADFAVDLVASHRWVEPFAQERDRRITKALHCEFRLYEGETLLPPGTLRTGAGKPYSVFTPFSRAFSQLAQIGNPLPPPKSLPELPADIRRFDSTPIPTMASLELSSNPNLQPAGEKAAKARLKKFLNEGLAAYSTRRDRTDIDGTSRLSPHLKFGTLSVRQVWTAVNQQPQNEGARVFLKELIWREFSHSTLWDRPEVLTQPFRENFAEFPWRQDDKDWRAWVDGKTGYPMVDASCRQLLGEGFVHNRARMISASFLTKHLLLDYRLGEAHYLKYLTDGDWAQNNAGWQWSAGCGCDAQPYFRVFNPITQGKKFDPDGNYVRQWVPELKALPSKFIHSPWEAKPEVLEEAGVILGGNYPHPIVDHKAARERYLQTATGYLKKPKD